MKLPDVTILGTGYVGTVTSVGFADKGLHVTGYDKDASRVQLLRSGKIPMHEPGLESKVSELTAAVQAGRPMLRFTQDITEAVDADIVFACLPTPSSDTTDPSVSLKVLSPQEIDKITSPYAGWELDTGIIQEVFRQVVTKVKKPLIWVTKSTVPPGTARSLYNILREDQRRLVTVVSNPETLREGTALRDFMKPDRVITGFGGNDDDKVADAQLMMRRLYKTFLVNNQQAHFMSNWEEAELAKLAANFILAIKISAANQVANICEAWGANYSRIREMNALDDRIGGKFLYPGPGFGGSCFPKDTKALALAAYKAGKPYSLIMDVWRENEKQKYRIAEKVLELSSSKGLTKSGGQPLAGTEVAVWGLSFKPDTDDIREAPSITGVYRLLELGAHVNAHDPIKGARDKFELLFRKYRPDLASRLHVLDDRYEATRGAQALVTVTEHSKFEMIDFDVLKAMMKGRAVIDGRNRYDPEEFVREGFRYEGIGRPILESVGI